MLALPGAPFGVTYRELWLPPGIKGWTGPLPPSVEGGHELTFTGARHGTTADGVHFTGAADSLITCGAIHNAAAKLVVSFRFKLDQTYNIGDGDRYLWGKVLDGNNYLQCWIANGDAHIYFQLVTATVTRFAIGVDPGPLNAGVWRHLICSIGQAIGGGAASDGARLRIDNGVATTDADVTAIPNGGDFIIGDNDDPSAGNGIRGVIADFFVMTDDVTGAEETDLFNGIPPADAVNAWLLDEGRGVTAYDRGSGGNNGTLDTTATWAFGQVQQPVMSFNGITAIARAGAGVDISGDFTLVWAGKIKSTYRGLSLYTRLLQIRIGGTDDVNLWYFQAGNVFQWSVMGSGTTIGVNWNSTFEIDDYAVVICTNTLNGISAMFINGFLIGLETGGGVVAGAVTTCDIGANFAVGQGDISKPLFCALIDGAFTNQQALAYSRYLRNLFNLPITI